METKKLRVVCLFGTGIIFDKSLSILLESGVNVVGVCNANKHKKGVDFGFLKIAIKKYGIVKVFLQIVQRLFYKIFNAKKDAQIFAELYQPEEINSILKNHSFPIHHTEDYQNPETVAWLETLKPDIFVVHTGYWVGKKVRKIVQEKCLGGHPGITPDYRGVHSPFWAAYNDEFEKIGYSVFWIDSGVDTGDILFQGKTEIAKNDSYFTLSWKGMIEIAKNHAKIIKKIESGEPLNERKVGEVTEATNYTHPTIFEYLKYLKKQKRIR